MVQLLLPACRICSDCRGADAPCPTRSRCLVVLIDSESDTERPGSCSYMNPDHEAHEPAPIPLPSSRSEAPGWAYIR